MPDAPDRKTPGWGMLDDAHRVLNPRSTMVPFGHLSDAELLAAVDLARQGIDVMRGPRGVQLYPGPVESWPPTGLEHLTDAGVLALLADIVTEIRTAGIHE